MVYLCRCLGLIVICHLSYRFWAEHTHNRKTIGTHKARNGSRKSEKQTNTVFSVWGGPSKPVHIQDECVLYSTLGGNQHNNDKIKNEEGRVRHMRRRVFFHIHTYMCVCVFFLSIRTFVYGFCLHEAGVLGYCLPMNLKTNDGKKRTKTQSIKSGIKEERKKQKISGFSSWSLPTFVFTIMMMARANHCLAKQQHKKCVNKCLMQSKQVYLFFFLWLPKFLFDVSFRFSFFVFFRLDVIMFVGHNWHIIFNGPGCVQKQNGQRNENIQREMIFSATQLVR